MSCDLVHAVTDPTAHPWTPPSGSLEAKGDLERPAKVRESTDLGPDFRAWLGEFAQTLTD